MKVRYSISEKWKTKDIVRVMDGIKYAVDFFGLDDDRSTLTLKLITGTKGDTQSATACRVKNRRYEVRLNYSVLSKQPAFQEAVMKALFHEMTHVKQFIFNGLRLGAHAKWEGREFNNDGCYWFSPWEMEARALEEPLYRFFEEEY